jgi:type I restriction enzyme S subunit
MNELKASKYQAYPEYKDSGVEWLEDVPRHWGAKPLKYLCSFNDDVLPDNTNKDFELCYVDIGSVSATEGLTRTETMTYDKAPSRARRLVQDGDVIVSTVRTYLEAIAPINNPPSNMVVSTGFAVIRPNIKLYKGYAAYCLRASGFIKEVVARSVGVSYPAINASDLVSISIPSLPMAEQIQIANFLDHETAKIDTLIDKQQQLIKLLKEKRQAVISHAVTKGLNAQAPMKDSGVEWLGEVPAHWSICTLKRHANFIDGDRSSEYPNENDLKESGVLFLSSKNISNGKLSIKNANFISSQKFERLNRGKAIDGDLIVKVRGSTGRIGELAIFEADRIKHITAFINAQMMIIRVEASLNNYFLSNIAQAHYWMEQLNLGAYGTAQQQLNNTVFANVIMVVPPLCEQKEINAHLGLVTNHFDSLINKATSAIKLMQERRTALISAAVTGKIDVRNWIEPTEIHEEK